MAKEIKGKKSGQAKLPKPECINVSSKIRDAFPFIDAAAQNAKEVAVREKRKGLRKKGRELSARRLRQVSDALERVQRLMNPLIKRREKLVNSLLAHYGHERINEIAGSLGNTRITESFVLAIENPEKILESDKLTPAQRKAITKAILAVDAAFAASKLPGGEELMKLLLAGIKVSRFTLAVVPPSSRTPNTGEPKEDPEASSA